MFDFTIKYSKCIYMNNFITILHGQIVFKRGLTLCLTMKALSLWRIPKPDEREIIQEKY